jgi:hypothetical protein
MMKTITAHFETRRQVELAVEHCVQDYGLERSDIFIQPAGSENSAGSVIAGADAESGHPGTEKHGSPALSGLIEVSADVDDERVDEVRTAFEDAGGIDILAR